MRVVLDMSPAQFTQGGTRTYTEQLALALRTAGAQAHLDLRLAELPPWLTPDGSRGVRHKLRVLGWDYYYMQRGLPRQASRVGADLLHAPTLRIPLHTDMPVVVTVFDMIPLLYPRYYRLRDYLSMRLYLEIVRRRAAHIITISEQSRQDIIRLLKLGPERVSTTYLGAAPSFRPVKPSDALPVLERHNIRQPYILSVCTLEPRKNLVGVLEAFARLCREQAIPHRLVLTGRRGWKDEAIFATLERLGIAERVTLTGFVPEKDLPALYSSADLFVYVPFYEGFGLPPLEAMACGAPVVTSNSSSLPEVVGDAALQIDPENHDALAAAMASLVSNPGLGDHMRALGFARASLFSWERCAHETLSVYRNVTNTI